MELRIGVSTSNNLACDKPPDVDRQAVKRKTRNDALNIQSATPRSLFFRSLFFQLCILYFAFPLFPFSTGFSCSSVPFCVASRRCCEICAMSKNAMRTDNRQQTKHSPSGVLYQTEGSEQSPARLQTLSDVDRGTESRKGRADGESVKAKDFCRASCLEHAKK